MDRESYSEEIQRPSFAPKSEASFFVHESEMKSFYDFLSQYVRIVCFPHSDISSDSGKIYTIEVSDVEPAEAESLIEKYAAFRSKF